MNVNITGFISLLLAIILFIGVYATSKKASIPTRIAFLFLFSVFSTPSVLVVICYSHILPESECLYWFRALQGSEFAILFPAVAIGILCTFLPRVLMAFPLFALILIGTLPYIKPLVSPLDFNRLQDQWSGNASVQSTLSTCGPACIATILKQFGIHATERDIARDAHSYAGGTEAWYLARVVRKNGLETTFVIGDYSFERISLPAIAGVLIGGMGHFIIILSHQGNTITYVDPLSGEHTETTATFLKRHRLTGFYMSITKEPEGRRTRNGGEPAHGRLFQRALPSRLRGLVGAHLRLVQPQDRGHLARMFPTRANARQK